MSALPACICYCFCYFFYYLLQLIALACRCWISCQCAGKYALINSAPIIINVSATVQLFTLLSSAAAVRLDFSFTGNSLSFSNCLNNDQMSDWKIDWVIERMSERVMGNANFATSNRMLLVYIYTHTIIHIFIYFCLLTLLSFPCALDWFEREKKLAFHGWAVVLLGLCRLFLLTMFQVFACVAKSPKRCAHITYIYMYVCLFIFAFYNFTLIVTLTLSAPYVHGFRRSPKCLLCSLTSLTISSWLIGKFVHNC